MGSVIDLFRRFRKRDELVKQKAIWLTFGLDYEAEKEKLEEIWRHFGREERKKTGGYILGSKYVQSVFAKLEEIDPQKKRGEFLKLLEKLAKYAYKRAMAENVDEKLRLKWANIAIYAYQTMNGILARYESKEILLRMRRLKQAIDELRAERTGKK
jgi:hypothetical protein